MVLLLVTAVLILGLMLSLAKAEPQTSRLRHHRLVNQDRELARMKRDRF